MDIERKTGLEQASEKFKKALKDLDYSIDVEREAAAGVMREVAWVLWGDESLFKLSAEQIYFKFKTEVYNKGVSGLLRR